jgi:hypothetical protein
MLEIKVLFLQAIYRKHIAIGSFCSHLKALEGKFYVKDCSVEKGKIFIVLCGVVGVPWLFDDYMGYLDCFIMR